MREKIAKTLLAVLDRPCNNRERMRFKRSIPGKFLINVNWKVQVENVKLNLISIQLLLN